ncbi:MAG: DoxX family protein [Chitinophagaceae bacterium]|nr:DoxX family protein [Chitinophagaceae bacterium]
METYRTQPANSQKSTRIFLLLARIIVGLLFIFSGLVKANDPLGLSYKMQEFFEVWGMVSFNEYTLFLSLVMNTFEIVAGVAVLLGWRMKMFSWLLLLLIIFFTILTGYAQFSGKIKTCGCFGDCIPLTALQSFIKDLILLALILVLFVNRSVIKPFLTSAVNGLLILLSILFCIVLQWYVMKHLPIVDCLPYKVGNNIAEKMRIPDGAVADSFAITFSYKKAGKDVEFDMNNFPDDFDDSTYQFVERNQKLIRSGNATAAINDFSLRSMSGTDTTLEVLNQGNTYVMLLLKNIANAHKGWDKNAAAVAKACNEKKIPFFVVSAVAEMASERLKDIPGIYYLQCDATVIKTAGRENPTYLIMKQANILGKYADADYEKVIQKLK